MIIALDINAEYIISFEYYKYLIPYACGESV